ncbi:putative Ig domain-containing protein, partial [uncultured Vibrio sp.]|uniref:putative Ig domain-containing protein n=1 Tax=uncultured Vibrio sp. TaxID=114054 RepID=UPI0026230D07
LAAADVGEYSFNVLISDGIDTVESIGSYVGLITNSAPTIDTPIEMVVDVDVPFSHQVVASDIDNDTLTYTLVNAPPWMTINSATGVISGTVSNSDFGDYTFTVTVSDDEAITQDTGKLSSLLTTNYQGNKLVQLQAEYTTPIINEVSASIQSTQAMELSEYVSFRDYKLELDNGFVTLSNGTFTPIDSLLVYLNGEDSPTKLTLSTTLAPYTSAILSIAGLQSIDKVVEYNQKLIYSPVVRLENWSYSCDGVDACYSSPVGEERVTFERTLSYIHDFSNKVNYIEEMESLFTLECQTNNSYSDCAAYNNDLIEQGTSDKELPYWYKAYLTIGVERHALRTAVMRDHYEAEGLGGGSRPELIHYYALSNGWGSIWQ